MKLLGGQQAALEKLGQRLDLLDGIKDRRQARRPKSAARRTAQ
jgi:hypothetical protein